MFHRPVTVPQTGAVSAHPLDEHEPELAESQRIAADLAGNVNKAERAHQRNDAAALDIQVQLQAWQCNGGM